MEFFLAQPYLTFIMFLVGVLVIRSCVFHVAQAIASWGTKHCASCACGTYVEQEQEDDEDSETQEEASDVVVRPKEA